MKKYKLEIILFIVNAIYMILELIASRILSPYFGSSNLIWTSVIGIILLSTSVGNYIGGIIADKSKEQRQKLILDINVILIISGILILFIPVTQKLLISQIISLIKSIKIGAILATIVLFFVPSMFIGMLSPIIIKLKMNKLESVGKISGGIYALATLGSIVGTFLGGFFLIPNFGSNQILFVLSIVMFLLNFLLYEKSIKSVYIKLSIGIIIGIIIDITCFWQFSKVNAANGEKVLNGELGVYVNYDTQYGKITIYNSVYNESKIRHLNIDKGNESATYLDEDKNYELVFEYTKYYDLMFKSSKEIKETLLIGGAGYSYPKYYISHYPDKKMDVVEIDKDIVNIAKKYFYLDKLIEEYNLEENKRLNLITQDGRIYLNTNSKKYDAILNDSFSGNIPAKTLTTKEAAQKIHNSLNKDGVYLTNIISSIKGENSGFLKAEVNTLKQVFKNVYIVPCNTKTNLELVQNNMIIATDSKIYFEDSVQIDTKNAIVLTDNFCPVDTIIPKIYR